MVTQINNRSLIKIYGNDAESFLQSQFSNNLKKIQDNEIQINAYCQHQGKIIAIIWVFKKKENFYLSVPNELLDLVMSKLNMFKMLSQVKIEDFSSKVYQYGLINEDVENSFRINDSLSLLTSREQLNTIKPSFHWEIACINAKLPEVYLKLSEKYIPQELNLDINEFGVSFTKGCYPGQEVVARMHYLGKPKRRLFRFTSEFQVATGDNLNVKDSKSLKSSGQVIRVARKGTEFQFLAVFEVRHINDHIFLNNDQTKLVNIIHE